MSIAVPAVVTESVMARVVHGIAKRRRVRDLGLMDTCDLAQEMAVRLLRSGTPVGGAFQDLARRSWAMMHRIIIDHHRAQVCLKRTPPGEPVDLDSVTVSDDAAQRLELLSALEVLGRIRLRQAVAIEMKYFGQKTLQEVADCLGICEKTVQRDLDAGRAWLRVALS